MWGKIKKTWRIISNIATAMQVWQWFAGGGLSITSAIIAFLRDAPVWLIVVIGIAVFVFAIVGTIYVKNHIKSKKSSKEIDLDKLERTIISFRKYSEQMFEETNKCTLRACCTNPSSQMISSGKIEASGEGGRNGVQLD